jgi:hypothetical protein
MVETAAHMVDNVLLRHGHLNSVAVHTLSTNSGPILASKV